MDPIKVIPAEVVEMILDYLSPKQVLACTLISQDWNNLTGTLLKCMEKLTLKMSGKLMKSFTKEDKENFAINRKFSKIICSDATEILPFVQNVMEVRLHWKSVNISFTDFASTSDFIKLVKTFESTVEHLELHHVKILNPIETRIEFRMKKLKSLSIANCDANICLGVMNDCPALKSLTLGEFPVTTDLTVITESFKRFTNLKKLDASPMWFNVFFEDKAPKFQFQLEDLVMANDMNYTTFRPYYKAQRNVFEFLATQKHSLKKLKLGGIFVIQIIDLAFRMTKLEELCVPSLSMLTWPKLNFASNSTIKTLDIASLDFFNKDIMRATIKYAPNLKYLRMRTVDRSLARHMARKLQHLDIVSITHAYDDSVRDILPNVSWRDAIL